MYLFQKWLLVDQAALLGKRRTWQSFQESWSVSKSISYRTIWATNQFNLEQDSHFLLRMGWNRALLMRVLTLLFLNSCNSFGKIESNFPCFSPINYLFICCRNQLALSNTFRVSKLALLGGPGLGVRDVLIPQTPQTQENGNMYLNEKASNVKNLFLTQKVKYE